MAVSWAPILKWIMIVNWALSSLCPDASQSSTAPQPANTSDQDKKETLSKNVYENVTVNPNSICILPFINKTLGMLAPYVDMTANPRATLIVI